MEEKNVIGRIPLNEGNEIQISLSSYKDSKYLDIRKFYQVGNDWRPTKSGITFKKDQLSALSSIIKDNNDAIKNWLN